MNPCVDKNFYSVTDFFRNMSEIQLALPTIPTITLPTIPQLPSLDDIINALDVVDNKIEIFIGNLFMAELNAGATEPEIVETTEEPKDVILSPDDAIDEILFNHSKHLAKNVLDYDVISEIDESTDKVKTD